MSIRADVREVVATRAEAARLARPPLLVVESLAEFLDAEGLGTGPIDWERIGDGQSNVTFSIRRGSERFVVRRGPRPPLPRSTHDMVREARIQRFVGKHGLPVPKVLAVCANHEVLGVPFYVMAWLDGQVVTDSIPAALNPLEARRATSEALVDLLGDLHSIPIDFPEAQSLGRPDGYLRRQVGRFSALWEGNTTRNLPAVARLGAWLADNLPRSQASTVIHGDFRMGNVMFSPGSSAGVLALLDWEMATIGGPLADLGYLVATYADASSESSIMELTSVTRQPGYLTRGELFDRYSRRTTLDLSGLPWYETLALWKAAVFCEAIYTRWLAGERPDDTLFGPALEAGVPRLLELAEASAGLR